MSFIYKISLFILSLFIIISVHYRSFDFKNRFENLKDFSSKTYVRASFIFKSNDYKEFVYVK
ncbi:hypothetical protein [Arcobacter sp. CECT 8985]|uniref:hypothetical protein n=1 Tax=Arcobacter sp. CECT 8985 TaxID=1935424 RepID=UPI0010273C6C|nr:hypothetical protein [Arcobacter sp. CECT 8985]RXJ87144.1 hypothetical protein CRU93_05245 [Arcobacter sp. CECT 8985]